MSSLVDKTTQRKIFLSLKIRHCLLPKLKSKEKKMAKSKQYRNKNQNRIYKKYETNTKNIIYA